MRRGGAVWLSRRARRGRARRSREKGVAVETPIGQCAADLFKTLSPSRRAGPDVGWESRLTAFRTSHSQQTISAGGFTWSVLMGGAGSRAALLLHGSHADGESLFAMMMDMERDWRVITPTYPDGVSDVAQIVDGLASLLNAQAIAPALVVGYSLGGYVAQTFARRHAKQVSGLALLHTGGPAPSAARSAAWQNALLTAIPEPIALAVAPAAATALLALDAPGLTPTDAIFWRAYLADSARRTGKHRMLTHGQMVVDFLGGRAVDKAPLGQKSPRTLAVHGGRDRTIVPAERRALERLYPSATRVDLPEAGHLSVVTQPYPYVALINATFRAAKADV